MSATVHDEQVDPIFRVAVTFHEHDSDIAKIFPDPR